MRLLPGELDEALLAERALGGAQAVAVADADLPPLAVGVARGALSRSPLPPSSASSSAQARSSRTFWPSEPDGHVDQRALVVGDSLADPVQAGVVGAALEHGVRRVDLVADRLDQPRDVALDQLVLERERRGRDHDPLVVQQAGTR